MKKIIYSFSLFLSLFQAAYSLSSPPISVDINVAYFRPESKLIRQIYSNGIADYQLNVNVDLNCNLQAFTGVSYLYANGRSLCENSCQVPNFPCEKYSTNLSLLPVFLGLRYVYEFCPCTQVYLGGAAAYSFLKINDHFAFVHEHTKKNAFGGLVQIGAYTTLYEHIYLNVFVDYFFQKFNFSKKHDLEDGRYIEKTNLNLNGLKAGIGLGINF